MTQWLLTPNLLSPDPVDGNPFPEGDRRSAVWTEVTRKAELALQRLNARTADAAWETPAEYQSLMVDHAVTRFDIWSDRGVNVVWNEQDIAGFDQWLIHFANVTLLDYKRLVTNAPSIDPETLLVELRLRLLGRVEHWRAEARERSETLRLSPANQTPGTTLHAADTRAEPQLPIAVASSSEDQAETEMPDAVGLSVTPLAPEALSNKSEPSAVLVDEVNRRRTLMEQYQKVTGVKRHAPIYRAANVHKKEFYEWWTGRLLARSKAARRLESFLKSKQAPPAAVG
jgi:hypothetical protein